MNRNFLVNLFLLSSLYVCPVLCQAQHPEQTNVKGQIPVIVESFKLKDVRLLKSPFLKAEQVDMAYMMKLSPDRLLAPYLREAGLPAKAESYGNWENTGLDGHIAGHYLSALSMMFESTGSQDLLNRLNYMVKELKRCQDKSVDGYVGGIPGGRAMWIEIQKGNVEAIKSKWVPWYNLHKLFAGLRDAYEYTGNQEAKEMLIKLSDWCGEVVKNLNETQMQQMLDTEFGGMNEVLADVSVITGNGKYLELARKFSHHHILDPLLQHQDKLTGLHANTQIPKVIGFERIADLSGDNSWHSAAKFFWETMVDHRIVAFGGNSVKEHFNPINDFSEMITSPEGPETCNTYNMLKLTKMLYQTSGDLKYIDFYERALYNHILSSENLEHGGFVYFTPLRPRHYRVYSQPETSFWCCVGTGMENHSKYGDMIYGHTKDALFVNLFIPSKLTWKEKNVTIIQQTKFPDEENTSLIIQSKIPVRFTLKIRYPSWVTKNNLSLQINGKEQKVTATLDSYVSINRVWKPGDKIVVKIPMHNSFEDLPDQSGFIAIFHGPVLLAAKTDTTDLTGQFADDSRFGHIAHGKLYSLQDAPMLVSDRKALLSKIKRIEGERMTFRAPDLISPEKYKKLELVPFFRVGEARYMIYWQQTTTDNLKKVLNKDIESDKPKL